MVDKTTVLVVGGGQAGAWASTTLRSEGFEGHIVLAGTEPYLPYERPPLSKKVLVGMQSVHAHLRTSEDYARLEVDVRTGCEVTRIDLADHQASLHGNDRIIFDKLVMTTGSAVRRLQIPGADLTNVVYLRTLDDALALHQLLLSRPRTLIIGGGFIALEVAASAKALQCDVTILEIQSRLMQRVAPPEIGRYFEGLHRDSGVDIYLNTTALRLEGDKRVERVLCADGRQFKADLVVIAIGVVPEVGLATASGLTTDNGIVVDAFGRTSHPNIFAAGDVTNHPNDLLGRRVRLECWQNAQNQAIAVARTICGKPSPYCELPWFWSEQYSVNLQIAGLPTHWDEVVVRGDTGSGSFSIFYLEEQRVVAVSAINSPRDIAVGRRLIERGTLIGAGTLANTDIQLKRLLK